MSTPPDTTTGGPVPLGHDDLTTLAILGSGGRSFDPGRLPDPVRAAVAADGPTSVLDAAAAWVLPRRSRLPRPSPLPVLDLPVDPRPVIGPAPCELVRRLDLECASYGGRPVVDRVGQAFDEMARRGLTIPLDLQVELAARRPLGVHASPALQVLAERDGLLRIKKPDAPGHDGGLDADQLTRRWAELDASTRSSALRELRRADPAAARRVLLDRIGNGELVPTHRAGLLLHFLTNVSAADADLVQVMRQDPAKEVLAVAETLARRIPGSPEARHLEELARAHVQVHRPRGLLGRLRQQPTRLVVTPITLDELDVGVGGQQGDAERMRQLVEGIDLHRWPELVGATAVDLARLDEEALDPAWWAAAAAAQGDPELAAVVAGRVHSSWLTLLAPLLDPETLQDVVISLLPHDISTLDQLDQLYEVWPEAVTRAAVDAFETAVGLDPIPGAADHRLRWLVVGVPPAHCREAAERLEVIADRLEGRSDGVQLASTVRSGITVLSLTSALHAAILATAPTTSDPTTAQESR